MDRRSFITGLAAGTSEAFSKKTRPVDTMNRIGGWTNGSVEVIDIKGVRIGEGRPKLIAPTTSKTEADLIATVKKFADMPALNVIEVRIDYLGKIDPKDYARITGEGFGSDMTFASVGGKASAPGQIPAEDCLRVLETLHKAMNP